MWPGVRCCRRGLPQSVPRFSCSAALPALDSPFRACCSMPTCMWHGVAHCWHAEGVHEALGSMYPASDMEMSTLVCVTSLVVQGLHMVRLEAEVLLGGPSALRQPDGKLCMAVAVAGAGMERWQGCRAVDCCTCVAAVGVLRLMLACRQLACRPLAARLLRPPSLQNGKWMVMRLGTLPSQQEPSLTPNTTCCSAHCKEGATWAGESVLISSAYSTSPAGRRGLHPEVAWALYVMKEALQHAPGFWMPRFSQLTGCLFCCG